LNDLDNLPHSRDGLSRKERIILHCLAKTQQESGARKVPTAMLYGRVLEYMDMSADEMQAILQKLIGD
jgi:hypothetical protein